MPRRVARIVLPFFVIEIIESDKSRRTDQINYVHKPQGHPLSLH